jgi:hypothetical protein
MNADIIALTQLGWKFSINTWVHPHCNTVQRDLMFQSPRMKTAALYHPGTDLIEHELNIVANDEYLRISALIKPEFMKLIIAALRNNQTLTYNA